MKHIVAAWAKARRRATLIVVVVCAVSITGAPGVAGAGTNTPDVTTADGAAGVRIVDGEVVAPQLPSRGSRTDLAPGVVLGRAARSQAAANAGATEHVHNDLDGDGLADLVVTRTNPDRTLKVSGRRGVDGTTLWSADIAGYYALPAKVGSSAAGGAYVYQVVDFQNPWRFTAIDAAGKVAWQREFARRTTPLYARGVADFWAANVVGNGATDLVVVLETYHDTPGGRSHTTEIQVFDGATGLMTWTYTDSALGWQPRPYPVGDVDGDGLADVVVAQYKFGSTGSVTLLTGRTGAPLWRNPQVVAGAPFTAVGDLDADGRQEIIVPHLRDGGGQAILSTTVLDGLTGLQEITVDGLGHRFGDLQADGDDELGITGAASEGDTVRVWLAVVDRDGTQLRRQDWARVRADGEKVTGYAKPVGDVDADGITDAELALSVFAGNGERVWHDDGVVAGASGQVLWSGITARAMFNTVDGQGDDYLAFSAPFFATQTTVTPFDGATGQALWTVELAGTYGLVGAMDVDGDGGADVVVRRGNALTVLRSADGSVLWGD